MRQQRGQVAKSAESKQPAGPLDAAGCGCELSVVGERFVPTVLGTGSGKRPGEGGGASSALPTWRAAGVLCLAAGTVAGPVVLLPGLGQA